MLTRLIHVHLRTRCRKQSGTRKVYDLRGILPNMQLFHTCLQILFLERNPLVSTIYMSSVYTYVYEYV